MLAVAHPGRPHGGGAPVTGPWPTRPPSARTTASRSQARLAALGYPVDDRTGRISLTLRDAIRAAQAKIGLVPDGNPTTSLLRALEGPGAR